MKNKNTGKHTGSRCSGYGVFPDGTKCKGCSDCNGKKLTAKGLERQVKKNTSLIKIKKK